MLTEVASQESVQAGTDIRRDVSVALMTKNSLHPTRPGQLQFL